MQRSFLGQRTVLGGLASLALVVAGLLGSTAAIGAAPARTAVYPNLVLRGISSLGGRAANPNAVMTIGVELQHRDAAGEARLEHAVLAGGRSLPARLTPAQFQARYGTSRATLRRAAAWLRAGGLRVTFVPRTTDYVLATGRVSAVGRLLHVRFRDFHAGGRSFRANVNAPRIAAALRVYSVVGLDTLQGPRLLRNRATPTRGGTSAAAPSLPSAPHRPALPDPNTNVGLSTPSVLWDVYDAPSSDRGRGQQMAIFGWGVTDAVEPNLRAEEREFGLPATPLTITHVGPEAVTDSSGADEWEMDTQASTGMAPDVSGEHLYFGAAGTDADLIAAYKAWVNDPNGPAQGSSSFGGCEEAPGTDALGGNNVGAGSGVVTIANSQQDAYDQALAQAVAEGRTMFASAGDTGSSCPAIGVDVNGVGNELVPLMNYPCVSQYAVCVGGTVLYYDGGTSGVKATRAMEYPWTYTGGGQSRFMAQPAYQNGVLPSLDQCLSDQQGGTGQSGQACRGVPDVAAQSGDVLSNGFSVNFDGTPDSAGGGTSLSSPLWLGVWARVQAASSGGTGFANPLLYAIGKDATAYGKAFHDIAPPDGAGGNGTYVSTPGWDYVSGWGSPDVAGLVSQIDHGNLAPVSGAAVPPVATNQPPQTNPCGPVFTDPAGDDSYPPIVGSSGTQPQLDIVRGDMSVDEAAGTLTTTLTLKDLSATVPTGSGGSEYYFLWTWNGVRYFTNAQVDPTGAISYSDGQISMTGNTQQYNTRSGSSDQGSFNTGPNGTVVVTVPLSVVGSPPGGGLLSQPAGETKALIGTTQTGGFIEVVDNAGPTYDYRIGEACPRSAGTTGGPTGSTGSGHSGTAPTPPGHSTAPSHGTKRHRRAASHRRARRHRARHRRHRARRHHARRHHARRHRRK